MWKTREVFGKKCHCVVGVSGVRRGSGKKLRAMTSVPSTLQLGEKDEKQELRGVNVSGSVGHLQKEKLKGVTCPRREYQ